MYRRTCHFIRQSSYQILLATISYLVTLAKSFSLSLSIVISTFLSRSLAFRSPSTSSPKIHRRRSSPTSTCASPPVRLPLASNDSRSAFPVAMACSLSFILAYRSRAYRNRTIPSRILTTNKTKKMSIKTTTMVSAAMASSVVNGKIHSFASAAEALPRLLVALSARSAA